MRSRFWCDQELLVEVDGPQGRSCLTVKKPFARVGSHKSSEVVLSDYRVARRSLYFHATDEGVFCVDLHSPGREDSPRGWIAPGEPFTEGPYLICVKLADAPGSPPLPEIDLEARGSIQDEPYPVVIASSDGRRIGSRKLGRRLTLIGRRKPSSLLLTSHSISAAHCVLYWDSGYLWVIDLLSGNGTRMEDRLVEASAFPPGVCITLGRVCLEYLRPPNGLEMQLQDDKMASKEIELSPHLAQLDEDAVDFAFEKREFAVERESWEEQRRKTDTELAKRAEELTRQLTELDSQRKELKAGQQALQQQQVKQDLCEAELQKRNQEIDRRESILATKREEVEIRHKQGEEQKTASKQELSSAKQEVALAKRELNEQLAELSSEREALRLEKEQWERQRKKDKEDLDKQLVDLAAEREKLRLEKQQWEQRFGEGRVESNQGTGRREDEPQLTLQGTHPDNNGDSRQRRDSIEGNQGETAPASLTPEEREEPSDDTFDQDHLLNRLATFREEKTRWVSFKESVSRLFKRPEVEE